MRRKITLLGVGLASIAAFLLVGTSSALAAKVKVEVCHFPPGNPDNFHTITISENALPAHLAHGDAPGSCDAVCGDLCDDGDKCTVDDCDPAGGCVEPHPPVNCDDTNLCTTDSCDSVIDATSVNPNESGSTIVFFRSRMTRMASRMGIRRCPPLVLLIWIRPSSAQRLILDSLTPIALASCRGLSVWFMVGLNSKTNNWTL